MLDMLNKNVTDLLNAQVNHEFYSSYLYLGLSNYYKGEGLDGFANWFAIQAEEERDHAKMYIEYLYANGETVNLTAIAQPKQKFECFVCPLKEALRHERKVTGLIHSIYAAAHDSRDFRTMKFLDWFVKEQCEEEKAAEDLVRKYELFGSDKKALYLLDQELGARTYTPARYQDL